MNMKKTIAAIAAGSVAVSAMATTVSALEAKTLTYSLVQNVRQNNAEGTITYTFNTIPVSGGQKVLIKAIGAGPWSCVITVSGSYADVNESIQPTKFTERSWTDAYDKIPASMLSGTDDGGSLVTIPVVENIVQGKATNLHDGIIKNLTVTVDYYNLPASVGYTGALNDEIKAGRRGIVLTVMNGDTSGSNADHSTATLTTTAGITQTAVVDQAKLDSIAPTDKDTTYVSDGAGHWAEKSTVQAAGVTNLAGGAAGSKFDSNFATTLATAMDAIDTDSSTAGVQKPANGTYTATCVTAGAENVAEWKITGPDGLIYASAAKATGLKFVDGIGNEVKAAANDVFTFDYVGTAVTGTVAAFTDADVKEVFGIVAASNFAAGDELKMTKYTAGTTGATGTAAYTSDIAGAAVSVKGQTAREIPYRSSLKNSANITLYNGVNSNGNKIIVSNNAIGGGDVFWKIGLAAADNSTIVADGDVWDYYWPGSYVDQSTLTGYDTYFTSAATGNHTIKFWNDANLIAQNARAVVNDAIANYSDVTFVFNTAAKNVKVWTDVAGNVFDYEYTGDGASTTKTLENHNGVDGYVQVLDFTSFGRHYWDRDTGYDANTIYISNDWIGNNLFEGALIINNNLTLSLGATDKFDWTSTSLSFSWDAIQDSALTSNAYANYVQNMVLRTSADWYWDNMQVVLGETEDEDVGTTSPVEAEEEELEEVEPEVEAEPEEEPEEEPEVEAEPEVAPAANPGTGNAPVALAVIPVALAAAAIVAKKRG